jgi:hypothetical protein
VGDHTKEVLARIAEDLSRDFREKLLALGYNYVSITYSPKAPKENPEQFLPDYSPADVKATIGMHEDLMGPRGLGEVMRDRFVSLMRECVEIHDTVSNNIVKPNPTIIHGFVDKMLEAVWAEFELYRKPVRFQPTEHEDQETYAGPGSKAWANSEYGKREGVWTDPMPTGKFDIPPGVVKLNATSKLPQEILDQIPIGKTFTVISEVNSFSENPPMIGIDRLITRKVLDNDAEVERVLIQDYLKTFPAPPGMHNCLEVGCKVKFSPSSDFAVETLYSIDHVLPLAVVIPPVSGVDKDKYIAQSIPKIALCKANGCELTEDGPQHYDSDHNKLKGTPSTHAWFSDDPNAPKS